MNQSTKPLITVQEFFDRKKVVLNLGKSPWQLWVIALILASGTVGFTATSMLLRLPKSPQCTNIFWPVASASMRVYCAQIEADKGTVDSLLKAINLVEALSSNHPLRTEIDKSVEEWASAILDIGEEKFQSGQLQEAITVARKVSSQVRVYSVVEERIEKWRALWQEGEEICAEVEEKLRESEWNEAFRSAVRLLSLPNKYWATTEYDATVKQIQLAQEENSKLDKAYRIFRQGGVDNWLAAIADAKKISTESYVHPKAQNLIENAKYKLVDHIKELFKTRRWQSLLDVVDRLPKSFLLKEEMNDWKALANAGIEAKMGTVESLEMAIASAQVIDAERPLYQKAQDLINHWQLEIQDVTRLQEAQNLALGGTVVALEEAITKANLISFDRTLYDEAQRNIHRWRTSIQRQEDQPILDRAISLGNSKNYDGAIQAARQIGRGRILFREAQNKIGQWRQEIKAQKDLQKAYILAQGGTSQALGLAIEVVGKIPGSTQVSNRSRQALNRWSYQLLSIAEDKARRALFQEAINLAHIIPAESASYHGAQTQIKAWLKALNLPAPPTSSTPRGITKPPAPPASTIPLTNESIIETNY